MLLSAQLDITDYIANAKEEDRVHSFRPIVIGDGVWIAANAVICAGAHIPENCVIAAGAVVVGELPEAGCLYGGVPARKIRSLAT